MKRIMVTILAVLMLFSAAVVATGPLLGVSTVPVTGSVAGLSFGYDFGPMNLELWKLDLRTPQGIWIIGALWTPQIDNFGYRVGAKLMLDYQLALAYESFGFVVGVSQTWGPIQLYGELDLMPTGVLMIVPVVGINILFGELIPGDDGV